MLEAGGVGGVACDGHIHAFAPHDGYAFAHVVRAIAVHFRTGTVGIRLVAHFFQFTGEVVKFRLHIGEAVDAGNNHGSVLAQAVQDDAQGIFAYFVCHFSDFDSAFSCGEGFVSCQEGKALRLFAEEACGEVAVPESYFAVVCHGTGDAECLQAFANGFSSVGSVLATFLEGNGSPYDVCPFGVLETDVLGLLAFQIRVDAVRGADGFSLFDGGNAVCVQYFIDLLDTAVLTFKSYFSFCHSMFLLFYS